LRLPPPRDGLCGRLEGGPARTSSSARALRRLGPQWSPSRIRWRPGREGDGADRPRAGAPRPCTRTPICCGWSADRWLARRVDSVAPYERALIPAGPSRAPTLPATEPPGEPVKSKTASGRASLQALRLQTGSSSGLPRGEPIGSLGYGRAVVAGAPRRAATNLVRLLHGTVRRHTRAATASASSDPCSTLNPLRARPRSTPPPRHTGPSTPLSRDPRRAPTGSLLWPTKAYQPPIAPRSPDLPAQDLWESSRPAPPGRSSLLEAETTAGAIERVSHEAVKRSAAVAETAGLSGPHRLTTATALPRPRSGDRASTRR